MHDAKSLCTEIVRPRAGEKSGRREGEGEMGIASGENRAPPSRGGYGVEVGSHGKSCALSGKVGKLYIFRSPQLIITI